MNNFTYFMNYSSLHLRLYSHPTVRKVSENRSIFKEISHLYWKFVKPQTINCNSYITELLHTIFNVSTLRRLHANRFYTSHLSQFICDYSTQNNSNFLRLDRFHHRQNPERRFIIFTYQSICVIKNSCQSRRNFETLFKKGCRRHFTQKLGQKIGCFHLPQ